MAVRDGLGSYRALCVTIRAEDTQREISLGRNETQWFTYCIISCLESVAAAWDLAVAGRSMGPGMVILVSPVDPTGLLPF